MWCLIPICLLLIFYVMYLQGFLPVKSTCALTFVGSMTGRDRCSASFSACTGTVRRIVRFKEAGQHRFTLDSRMEQGSLQVTLLDKAGLPVVILNDGLRTASLCPAPGSRYTLLFTFTSATGSFTLHWEEISREKR